MVSIFFYHSISLDNYLWYTGRLFGYDKNVTKYTFDNFTFETFITNTAKISVSSLYIIALSFLTSRAINCFEPNNTTSYNPYFDPFKYPIVLCLLNSHFVPALPLNDESVMSIPEKNPFNSIFSTGNTYQYLFLNNLNFEFSPNEFFYDCHFFVILYFWFCFIIL